MDKLAITREEDLLQMLRHGSKIAFEFLYNKYYGVMYLHAYNKLRDRETAKDIVQDIFAGIWQKKEDLDIKAGLSSYLYASIRNKVIDYISKEKSKINYLDSLADYQERDYSTTDHLLREKMLQQQIENVLEQLPPRLREVFELSRKQHLSHKEISKKLNLSEQSVRTYIKDVLRILRMRFGAIPWILFVLYHKLF